MSANPTVCSVCGGDLPASARFCPACGNRTEARGDTRVEEVPIFDYGDGPANVVETEQRVFGLAPPLLTFTLGAAALVASVVLFVAGRWVLGLVLLVLALLLLALFLDAARRRPTSPVTRATSRLATGVGARTRFAAGSLSAWSHAGRTVVSTRREQRALQTERERVQLALGDAAYRESTAEMTTLRARMRDIDAQLVALDEAARETVEEARRRVADERVAVVPTERIVVEDAVEEPEREST